MMMKMNKKAMEWKIVVGFLAALIFLAALLIWFLFGVRGDLSDGVAIIKNLLRGV